VNIWTNLKVRTKIMILVAASCLALVLVGTFGIMNLSRMNSDEAKLDDGMQQTVMLQDIKSTFLTMRLDVVYLLSLSDASKIDGKEKDFAAQTDNLRSKLLVYEKLSIDAKAKEQITNFRQGFELYATEGAKLAGMAKAARAAGNAESIEAANAFATDKVAPLYKKPAQVIDDLVANNVKESTDRYHAGNETFRKARSVTMAVIALAVILALLGGALIASSVSRPIQSVLETLREVAGGNLAARSNITGKDEMGMLAREVNATAAKLHQIISMVANNSEQVASAAAELHSTAAEMASGAEEMASQAGTAATASEEMSATSGDIAQSCHSAASGALQSSQTAEEGASVVGRTVQVMGRIAVRVTDTAKTVENLGTRSEQIGEIINTIEDIADQTNLLALNAAIEAARAGEQGRGFAVVADEVRALAERTTKATREIGEMIKTIQSETRFAVRAMEEGVKEVESGTAEAAKSGAALQAILEQINDVNMQVSQIATAAEEQTATTAEISSNIHQINEVVQHTAHGAHESVIAANQLSRLAEELQKLVGQFNV
jgi:methyl-accepting chemotaxis protein